MCVWMEDIPQATEQLHQLPTLCMSVWTKDIPRVTKQRAPTRTLGIPCYACLFAKEDTPQVTEQPQELWGSHAMHVCLQRKTPHKLQSNHKNFPHYSRLFGHKTSLGLQNTEQPQELPMLCTSVWMKGTALFRLQIRLDNCCLTSSQPRRSYQGDQVTELVCLFHCLTSS